MSASQIVPLTVTFTPSGSAVSTATILGQVLDNGKTNWIPATSGGAIYLATSSAQGASETVVAGQSYYLTTGPDVPQQVTISVTGSASNATASPSGAHSSTIVAGASQTASSTSTAASSKVSSDVSTAPSTAAQSSASASQSSSSSAPALYSNFKWLQGAVLAMLCLGMAVDL
ncbi:hypothetical protein LTS14_007689 [Recurvomyces mirabilis]|uniref:uncharacterized protein n=1 Tax=Recurvomyces mirabilis TaxID=574656 RepID=UPI002DDF7866|nr:hypothetical protein LTS14_007689 [Recurvomyces mirabilis]